MVTTHRDIGNIISPEMKQEPIPETVAPVGGFLVKFENNSQQTQEIWFADRPRIKLPKNQFFETIIKKPENIYSRYSLVEYLDDEVKLTIRPDWVEPEREWPVVEFTNLAGRPLETLTFQEFKITMPKGIPVFASWSIFSPISEWKNYSIKLVDSPQPEYTEVRVEKVMEHIEGTSELEGYSDKVEYDKPVEKRVAITHEATVLQKPDIVLENRRSPDELELLKLMQADSLATEKEYRLRQ